MEYKSISTLAIHDISGVGKCSLTVALPVLSACGIETSVLPTALLSTHTGGFSNFTYKDLTDEMMPIATHWKEVGCKFDAIYTGFLGSVDQIELVEKIFSMFKTPDNLIMVDPVMGDNGKLYQTYTESMAKGVAHLCQYADIVVPNMTEASYILGFDYDPGPYAKDEVIEILKKLCEMGPKKAVLTGIWFEDGLLGSACFDASTNESSFYFQDHIDGYYHGTGDLFASTLLGSLQNGMPLDRASKTAVDFTWNTIKTTRDYSTDYKFGPKFEVHLPWLSAKMEEQRKLIAK